MTTPITTVSGKGAPLNISEFDTNLVNLRNAVDQALANTVPAAILAALLTVDGAGSGLDADKVDGIEVQDIMANQGTIIGAVDLNNYITTGYWEQPSDTDAGLGTNYPVAKGGQLIVVAATVDLITQSYYANDGSSGWRRTYASSVWSSWSNLTGPAGPGVPAGGTAGFLLAKIDGTDYNTHWIDPTTVGVTDHGLLTGLGDDDHTQYHNDARGDARYAPIAKGVTNGDTHDHAGGDGAQIDHGGLAGLGDDDHTQYHNDTRGDARYLKLSGGSLVGSIIDQTGGGYPLLFKRTGTKSFAVHHPANDRWMLVQSTTIDAEDWDWAKTLTFTGTELYLGDNAYKFWHQNNDGAGSGLDADTVDGSHASAFAAAAAAVPAGGSIGQVLAKASAADYDLVWQSAGGSNADTLDSMDTNAAPSGTVTCIPFINSGYYYIGENVMLYSYSALCETYSRRSSVVGNNIYTNPSDTVDGQVRYRQSHANYGHAFIEMYGGATYFYNKTEATTANAVVTKQLSGHIDANGNWWFENSCIFDGTIYGNLPGGAFRLRDTVDTNSADDLGIFRSASYVYKLADWNTGAKGIAIDTSNDRLQHANGNWYILNSHTYGSFGVSGIKNGYSGIEFTSHGWAVMAYSGLYGIYNLTGGYWPFYYTAGECYTYQGAAMRKVLTEYNYNPSPSGYALQGGSNTYHNPPNGSIYYIGAYYTADTAADRSMTVVPKAGTIKTGRFMFNATGVAGSSETIYAYIRINGTETLLGSISSAAAKRIIANDSLSLAVSAGDTICMRLVGPTWVTNPTTVWMSWSIYIET